MNMKSMRKLLLTGLGAGLLIFLLGQANTPRASADDPKPVLVTNVPLPVSMSGTANISGAVNAAQSGPWSVTVNGIPTVNVASLPAVQLANSGSAPLVVKVAENPARQPFHQGFVFQVQNTVGLVPVDKTFDVPTGKRLVVEHVSARATADINNGNSTPARIQDLLMLFSVAGGDVAEVPIGPFQPFDSSSVHLDTIANLSTRLYADGTVTVRLVPVAFDGYFLSVDIFGYLVDLP